MKQNLALILMVFFLLAAAMGSADPSGSRNITSDGAIVEVTDANVSTLLGALGYASSSLASGREEENPEEPRPPRVRVPEPPVLLLLGIALVVIAALRFRRVS